MKTIVLFNILDQSPEYLHTLCENDLIVQHDWSDRFYPVIMRMLYVIAWKSLS